MAVARGHPGRARAIGGFDERVHAITGESRKRDARFLEILAAHALYGIAMNGADRAYAFHTVTRRGGQSHARRPAEIPRAWRGGSIPRRRASRNREANRQDFPRRDRNEYFRSSNARAPAAAD